MDADTTIDERTGEVLDPEVDFTYQKNNFLRVDFIAHKDHKITCRKAEGSHLLNGTDTLDN